FSHAQKRNASVVFTTPEPKKGILYIAIYDSEQNFLKIPLTRIKVDYNGNKKNVVIKDLELGKTVCISAFLDEDLNGKLDKNFLGIPLELYGFSQDARGSFGPPKFKEASFVIKHKNILIINLK
ncbi:hypothetical protein DBR28_15035, partial [Chryseobacterium sp. HMWF028]